MAAYLATYSASLAAECRLDRFDEEATVKEVVDGDTVRLTDGRYVRLVGINSPEIRHDGRPAEPFATDARDAVRALLAANPKVMLRHGREAHDRYHRVLADVYLSDRRSVQQILLDRGLAMTVVIPPNDANLACYQAAEQHARATKTALWGNAYWEPVPVARLGDTTGFRRITGKVKAVRHSKSSVWIDLGPNLVLRVERENYPYFASLDLDKLAGRTVVARGWISLDRKGEQVMRVQHPADLETEH